MLICCGTKASCKKCRTHISKQQSYTSITLLWVIPTMALYFADIMISDGYLASTSPRIRLSCSLHIYWHSIWGICSVTLPGILSYSIWLMLRYVKAVQLAYILAAYLACILAFSSLWDKLFAFYLAYLLTFFLAIILTPSWHWFWHSFWHSFWQYIYI